MRERNVSVLLITTSEKTWKAITDALLFKGFEKPVRASSAGEARGIFDYSQFELVIVDLPLSDDFGMRLAVDVSENEFTQVLVLAKASVYDEVSQKFAERGVLTLRKPMERASFNLYLDIIMANAVKMRQVKSRLDALSGKLEEVRIVDRAKLMLISKCSMSEAEAHRYIEKTSMDTGRRRREVAEKIIESLK